MQQVPRSWMLPSIVRIRLDEFQDESNSCRSNGAGLPRAGRVFSAREAEANALDSGNPSSPRCTSMATA